MPSMTSTSTTSPSSFSTMYWAAVAPTLPAPTTVIFGRRVIALRRWTFPACMRPPLQPGHVPDDRRAELRALHLSGALREAGQVVGHHPGLDRRLQPGDDAVGGVGPAEVAQHHLAREDDRARVDLVLPGVLGGGAVGGLEQGVPGVVVDVGAGGDADAAHLGGQGVGD